MIGDSWDFPNAISEAETGDSTTGPALSELEKRDCAPCRCPYHEQTMVSSPDKFLNPGLRPCRSFGPEEGPIVMNPGRDDKPSQQSEDIDAEQHADVRRPVQNRLNIIAPAFFVFILPSNISQPPRVLPVYPGECIALVILRDYLEQNQEHWWTGK